MKDTKIEWAHHTFNFVRGCTKVSEGCAHCYAESLAKRNPAVLGEWGPGKPRVVAKDAYWNEPLQWNRIAASGGGIRRCPECGTEGRNDCECGVQWSEMIHVRPRVFCASLADWLDEEIPIEVLGRLLTTIYSTPHLDWLLLTKRPQNFYRLDQARLWSDYQSSVAAWVDGTPPANVWVGTTVENQARANERIPQLLSIPAKVRFLSVEPMLGTVNLSGIPIGEQGSLDLYWPLTGHHLREGMNEPVMLPSAQKIHWVICGGESGHQARPMNPDWVRSLRNQCREAGVPFLFKQWGEWVRDAEIHHQHLGAKSTIIPFGDGDPTNFRRVYRVGKAAAGRRLDGVEHNEFPLPQ